MIYTNTIHNNNKMRKALQGWLAQGDFNFAATANFNRTTSLHAAGNMLATWQRNVDRGVLGRGWKKKPATDRIFFVAIPEHLNSNLHFHMLLRAPINPIKAQQKAAAEWRFLVPSGGMWISALNDIGDLSRVATYATKDLWNGIGIEGFIVSQ